MHRPGRHAEACASAAMPLAAVSSGAFFVVARRLSTHGDVCGGAPPQTSVEARAAANADQRVAAAQLNGVSVISAELGSPSCTSDSKPATSSNGKPYALPSTMCSWMIRE